MLTVMWIEAFWMLSYVYFSERFCRILKSRDPLFEAKESSSSMISLGVFTFRPRSISDPVEDSKSYVVQILPRNQGCYY